MPEHVTVTPEDLHVSAATVDAHADSVRGRHFAADGHIEAAQAGLPAASLTALTAAVTKWQADTTRMFGRMLDHADGLRSGAAAYVATDRSAQSNIKHAEREISEADLGL